MKKLIIVVVAVLGVIGLAVFLPSGQQPCDYLRIHIRANSNSALDQGIKYEIKDKLVAILTPFLNDVKSKDEAIKIVNEQNFNLVSACQKVLRENGLNYSVNVKISNEYFPTRTYSNTTLESGYYDAVLVELGNAIGDNWWCVKYPPICFGNKQTKNISFKSKIWEWLKAAF